LPSAQLAVVVGVVAAILLIFAYLGVQRLSADAAQRRTAELNALKERLMRERLPQGGLPVAPDVDPTEAKARRELERLQRQLETMPRAAGAGEGHLPGSQER
jgi:Flp pilus assembly protein TadB